MISHFVIVICWVRCNKKIFLDAMSLGVRGLKFNECKYAV